MVEDGDGIKFTGIGCPQSDCGAEMCSQPCWACGYIGLQDQGKCAECHGHGAIVWCPECGFTENVDAVKIVVATSVDLPLTN